MKNQRPRKRKTEKTNGKDVFVCIPPENPGFYLKFSLAKAPPKPLLAPELELYFSRHGVARFYDENGLFLEIWMGARKVRIGTQADIDKSNDVVCMERLLEVMGGLIQESEATHEELGSLNHEGFNQQER